MLDWCCYWYQRVDRVIVALNANVIETEIVTSRSENACMTANENVNVIVVNDVSRSDGHLMTNLVRLDDANKKTFDQLAFPFKKNE